MIDVRPKAVPLLLQGASCLVLSEVLGGKGGILSEEVELSLDSEEGEGYSTG